MVQPLQSPQVRRRREPSGQDGSTRAVYGLRRAGGVLSSETGLCWVEGEEDGRRTPWSPSRLWLVPSHFLSPTPPLIGPLFPLEAQQGGWGAKWVSTVAWLGPND